MNSKFSLKVSVYEYFTKFGEQTKNQQIMKVLLNRSIAYCFSSIKEVSDLISKEINHLIS